MRLLNPEEPPLQEHGKTVALKPATFRGFQNRTATVGQAANLAELRANLRRISQ
jgi:hypothetical protein